MQHTDLNHRHLLQRYWQERAAVRRHAEADGKLTLAEKLAWQDVLRRHMPPRRQLRVVEVGTGTGGLALTLAQMRHRVIGVDWSAPMLSVARQRAWERQLPCTFMEASAAALPLPNQFADAVVAKRLLSELEQPEAALAEWLRILKPGGRLVVIELDWSDEAAALLTAAEAAADRSPLASATLAVRQRLPLWQPQGAALAAALTAAGFEALAQSALGGQLAQAGAWRGRQFEAGYALISAATQGHEPLRVIQNGSS